jgi:iron(III) transport system ATP-binding protein
MKSVGIERLTKRFGASDAAVALRDISLAVGAGELVVLLGPSGSGKTTLLRCIAGLTEPTAGTIRIGDRTIVDCDRGIAIPTHRRGLGMVFQNFALWPHMTVGQNVAYPLHGSAASIESRVAQMLSLVHCAPLMDRLPSTLSGGQQQRIALARALAAAPDVLLFDEPLSNLDALLRLELRAQLRFIHRRTGFTGIYVTHDQAEALSLGTRIAVMNQGRIEQIATPEEVYQKPATEFVAEFMGMGNRLTLAPDGTRCDGSGLRVIGFEPSRASAPAGTVAVRFRPESLALDKPGNPSTRGEDGPVLVIPDVEIVDRAFAGEHVEYSVQSGPLLLKARVARSVSPSGVGERACAVVSRADAALFEERST